MSEEGVPTSERPRRSLDRHMAYGSAWMIVLRWAIRLTGLVSTVILARVLTPGDFGIVAMAMFVVGMLELLNQSGQKLVIIRHPSPTREDYDTAWTLSVLGGFVIAALIFAAAPLTASYFHEPRVGPVMDILALRSVLGGLENIGITDLRRTLQFDKFFLYNVYPRIVSFFITITLAFVWRNYWALVAGIISSQLAMNILSFSMHPYRPRWGLAKLADMWSFSTWSLVKVVGGYFTAQVDQIIVGGLMGSSAMGRYSVATDLASSPSKELTEPMVAALYPVMSRARSDHEAMKRLYLRTFGWSAVICFSTATGVLMVAHDLVHLILGNKWFDVEPLMGWLALSAGLLGLSTGAYTAFDAVGKPYLGAQMVWIRLIVLLIALLVVCWLFPGVTAIAIVRFIVTLLFIPTLLFAIGREISVLPADYLAALWRPVLASASMSIVLYFANLGLAPGIARLLCDIAIGVVTFGAVLLHLWWWSGKPKGPESDVVSIAPSLLRKLKLRFTVAKA